MKEHPILFSTPMIQAILEGRKMQTRRTCKLQPGEGEYYEQLDESEWAYISLGGMSGPYTCPYGKIGDVLWVRETYGFSYFNNEKIIYKAGPFEENVSPHLRGEDKKFLKHEKWKPSIFMPKAACRIKLKISSIKTERLQSISEEDAIVEGILKNESGFYRCYSKRKSIPCYTKIAIHSFSTLWKSINGSESWDKNPWVWAIEFNRIEK